MRNLELLLRHEAVDTDAILGALSRTLPKQSRGLLGQPGVMDGASEPGSALRQRPSRLLTNAPITPDPLKRQRAPRCAEPPG